MSLFPAYAQEVQALEQNEDAVIKPDWLENSSFKSHLLVKDKDDQTLNQDSISVSSASDVEKQKPKKKKRNKTDKKHTHKDKVEEQELAAVKDLNNDLFVIDKKQTREYLTVNTISRPAVSKYRIKYYLTSRNRSKRHKFKRYFKYVTKLIDGNAEEPTEGPKLTKENLNKLETSKVDEHFTGFSQEEELSKTTAFYNRTLTDNPSDVQTWLKYVDFQNTIYQFEKSYRKGSIAKAQRVLAERKISILDKALSLNPGCEALLRERLNVAVSAFPADELQAELKKLLEKEKDNIILWQGYIEATQCSMSHCNSPAVLSLYTQCLSTLHQLRRNSLTEKELLEESILRMMYQCGLFLKQAGLFEQLWVLLKMYLELNLSPTDKERFNIEKCFSERELLELEEIVFNSQLPHHELWLRTEKLRESCHWLPYVGGEQSCEDPQRMVFTEDVVELIHPIATPENVFKLVATILTLLKVPLLPCRHTTMQNLGLDYVPWSLDSIEVLLPAFWKLYPIDTSSKNLLKDTNRLAVGPQYLKVLPGQEEYLNFLLSVLESCAESLKGLDQIAVRIWWFRFQRLLIVLGKQDRFKMPSYLKKKIKSSIKDLLKREEHRNNEIFYTEYALIEKELGNEQQCVNILKTALSMNNLPLTFTENWNASQANRCYLNRILIETMIEIEQDASRVKDAVLRELLQFVLQRKLESITAGLLMEAETRFRTFTEKLLDIEIDLQDTSTVNHFLPDFFSDFIICHGWFLFYYKDPLNCGEFLESALAKLNEKATSFAFQKEVLYEFYCAIMFKYCTENPGSGVFNKLDKVLFEAIEKYPNNQYLLSVLAKEQSLTRNVGIAAWRVQELLLKSGRAIATIFVVIINDMVMFEVGNDSVADFISGDNYELSTGFKNKTLSLYKKITRIDTCTRRCGLVWRLYLQFVNSHFDPKLCRNTYYRAVEECPWLKALYMDAAIYIPAELGQIQDLIIEKQLRLHVTPEELDILRN